MVQELSNSMYCLPRIELDLLTVYHNLVDVVHRFILGWRRWDLDRFILQIILARRYSQIQLAKHVSGLVKKTFSYNTASLFNRSHLFKNIIQENFDF